MNPIKLEETTCDGCGKYWLGKFYDKPMCNECVALLVQDQEQRWGEPAETESEAYINAHD